MKDNYLPQGQKDLQEKYVNVFRLLQEYPEPCKKLKIKEFEIAERNEMTMFKNCDGFKYALDRLKDLLYKTEYNIRDRRKYGYYG